MEYGFIVTYLLLLFFILCEGREDTPTFVSLPRSPTDYVRIIIHGLEVLVVSWFFVGGIILGVNSGYVAASISCGLCLLLAVTAAATRSVDPRFAGTAYRIAGIIGLLSLLYMFLIS